MFTVLKDIAAAPHRWTVLHGASDPSVAGDPLVARVAAELRLAYGEDRALNALTEILADGGVAAQFDVEAILAGLRQGLPDPDLEAAKPAQLRVSRSETAEMVARVALQEVLGVRFPVAAQLTKGNANQPVLGFDGWGLLIADAQNSLVLVQVKATDDHARPPSPSAILHQECGAAPSERGKIARALASLAATLRADVEVGQAVFQMLAAVGRGQTPRLVIAPVLVRGSVSADMADLSDFVVAPPAPTVHGTSVSVGASLDAFGVAVVRQARAT